MKLKAVTVEESIKSAHFPKINPIIRKVLEETTSVQEAEIAIACLVKAIVSAGLTAHNKTPRDTSVSSTIELIDDITQIVCQKIDDFAGEEHSLSMTDILTAALHPSFIQRKEPS